MKVIFFVLMAVVVLITIIFGAIRHGAQQSNENCIKVKIIVNLILFIEFAFFAFLYIKIF